MLNNGYRSDFTAESSEGSLPAAGGPPPADVFAVLFSSLPMLSWKPQVDDEIVTKCCQINKI